MKLNGTEGDGHIINAVIMKNVCAPIACQSLTKAELDNFEHLRSIQLADTYDEKEKGVDILLGLDNYYKFMKGGLIKGDDGPVAVETTFGYVLAGRVPSKFTQAHMVTNTFKIGLGKSDLENVLNKFWDIESLGIEKFENVDVKIEKSIAFEGRREVCGRPAEKRKSPNFERKFSKYQKKANKFAKTI